MTKQEECSIARSQVVVKANELIQKSRFSLSTFQQKAVLFLISKIQPNDEDFKLYEFSISDFLQVCGITNDSGRNYAMLKSSIKEIADKSLWITLEDGRETLVRWIEKPYIDAGSGTIKIKLDADMKPFLLQLQDNFTKYELFWTLQFKRKYSVRLYELIKSIHYNEIIPYEKIYDLDELRKLLDADTYTTWQTFKVRVLEPAIEEINEYSDKEVEYEPITYGKTVGRIKLKMKTKDGLTRLELRVEQEKKLGVNFLETKG
jgi:plasmid replication initiation protein